MLRIVLLCTLVVHAALAKPLQQQHGGSEVAASHIVIVTPQAQVRLEPLSSAAAYLQHLSPYARYAAPSTHEETIVYVPAGSVGPVVPVAVAARSSSGASSESNKLIASYDAAKQLGNISQIQDITQQIQQSAGQFGPQFSEAATQGAQAIASAGQGFFPALFPPPTAAKIEYEAAAAAPQPLLTSEARHYYAIPAGVVPQVLDFVRGPVFVAAGGGVPVTGPVPASVVRARSIKEAPTACSSADMQKLQEEAKLQHEREQQLLQPLPQLKEEPLKEAIAQPLLKEAEPIIKQELLESEKQPEPEKKADFGRLLEENALKDTAEKKEEAMADKKEPDNKLDALPLKAEELKPEQPAQLKSLIEPQPLIQPQQLKLEEQQQPLKIEEPQAPKLEEQKQPELIAGSNKLLDAQALPLIAEAELPAGQLRSAAAVVDEVVGGGGGVVGDVIGGVVGGGVVDVGVVGVVPLQVPVVDVVPQAKIVPPV